MQTQKDKIPADISQIPQEILKSYDRFHFCRYLFFWDAFDLSISSCFLRLYMMRP